MTAHPLRPVVLAVSPRLDAPERLLAEIEALGVDRDGEHGRLAALSLGAARLLAEAAIALANAEDTALLAASDGFRASMSKAGTALSSIATSKWPSEPEGEDWQVLYRAERKFRKACLDMGTGCFSLASGRLPKQENRSLLTNISKAIPRELDDVSWTLHTLPDYGAAPAAPASPRRAAAKVRAGA